MGGRYKPWRKRPPTPAEPKPVELPDRDTEARVLQLVRLGSPPETAAATAGVRIETYRGWLRKGANGDAACRRFADKVAAAQAEAAATLAARVHTAARRDVRAAQWMLERMDREHFGRNDQRAGEELIRTVVAVLESELEADELDRVLAALERALRGEPPAGPRLGEGEDEPGGSEPAAPGAD